jgi:hypothetical protein
VRGAAALALLAVAVGGCKKQPQASPAFAQAIELHAKLYGKWLDEAYTLPEMDEVEALLLQVPAESLEKVAADELLARIRKERARLRDETAARDQAVADAVARSQEASPSAAAPASTPPQVEAPPTPVDIPDAGPSQPVQGMPEAEFTQRFSRCFRSVDPIEVFGKGRADAYELRDIANCRELHPGLSASVVLIYDRKILQISAKKSVFQVTGLPDGGVAADAGR